MCKGKKQNSNFFFHNYWEYFLLVVLLHLNLLNFPCGWAFRLFPVFTKRGRNIFGSKLSRAFVSLGLAFPEVKFLGQRFLMPLPNGFPEMLYQRALLLALAQREHLGSFECCLKNLSEFTGGQSRCVVTVSICISLIAIGVEPFKTCLFIIWLFSSCSYPLSVYLLVP